MTKDWFINALKRAIWTFSEVVLGFLSVGMMLSDVEWKKIFSVAAVAMIISFLKSIVTGLPEAQDDGVLMIDNSGDTSKWLFQVNTPLDKIEKLSSIRLKVDSKASLPKEEE